MGGKGEIEDLLWAVRDYETTFSDCLQTAWVECFTQKGKVLHEMGGNITPKELRKYCIDAYKRFDVLQKKRDSRTTQWDNFLKDNPQAFDFGKDEVVELKELKDFLQMF